MIFGLDPIEATLALAALLAALAVIWKMLVKPVLRAGRLIHRTYEKVMEYDDRLHDVEIRSEQLVNNSGSSLKDAVDRIEISQGVQSRLFAEHLDWAQVEILKVWQALAAKDTVRAAERTAEMMQERGTNGMD